VASVLGDWEERGSESEAEGEYGVMEGDVEKVKEVIE